MLLSGRALLGIFLLAFALRAGWGAARIAQHQGVVLEFPDEEQYWLMAKSLVAGEGLRDELGFRATRMPLYPALLAVFAKLPLSLYVAQVFHWLMGALAAVLAAKLGGYIGGQRVALLSGLVVALDPFLVFFSSLLLTETPFIAAQLGLWVILARMLTTGRLGVPRSLAAGLIGAACVYLRESSLALVVLALAMVLLARPTRSNLVASVCATAVVFASLLPWAVRNKQVTGSFTLLTHRGGISLYDGVRPDADGASDLGGIKQMPAVRGLDEVQWNKYFMDESLRMMREDPLRILRLAGTKLARMWNPVPNAQDYRSAVVRLIGAAWSLPLFALAVIGAVTLSKRTPGGRLTVLLLLPAGYLTLLHMQFVGSVRYRLPAMPMFAVLAAVSLAAIWSIGKGEALAEPPLRPEPRTRNSAQPRDAAPPVE